MADTRTVEAGKREPFNPDDPFDAVSETFRLSVNEAVLQAMKTTIYRELSSEEQIRAFISGTLVGLVGAVFAHMSEEKEGRDYIVTYMQECLPIARSIAEEIIAKNNAIELTDLLPGASS